MVASCERCKRRDEQDYRELDDQEKHFLMLMMGDFQHEMIIPEEFVRRLKDEIPGEIRLKTRNGSSYAIGLSKNQGKLVLTVGWGQFVKNFDLQMGDSIILRYNGNSQFNVIIFDRLGREKALSVVADAFLHNEQERSTEATETVNRSHGHHQSMQMQSPTEAVDHFHVHHQPQMRSPAETVNNSHGYHQRMQMQSPTEAVDRFHVHHQSQMPSPAETVNRSHGYYQRMQMQSPTEALDRFHVHHQPQMTSPPETANHCHGHPQALQTQSHTETLERSHVPPQPMQMQPSGETVNRSPMQPPPMKRQRQLQRDQSSQVPKTTLTSSFSVSSGDSFSSDEGRGVHSVPGYNYVVGKKTRLSSVQKKQLNDGYIATRRTKLTPVQEEQVKEKVQSMHADFPIFVAVMCKINVVSSFILTVPDCYAQKYLGDEQSVLLQRGGETWKVTFCGRQRESLNDRRFESRWQKFVQDNNLKMGDICLFERLSNQRCTMKVQIIRVNDGS
uniref:Uncharacterized protein n=1 Tax=Avena sativa TaxID=4498 RepID=A0ACD5X9M8_AVESA